MKLTLNIMLMITAAQLIFAELSLEFGESFSMSLFNSYARQKLSEKLVEKIWGALWMINWAWSD